MDRFLNLVDVVVSTRSETACVEVGSQPRLHVNADFIERHCRRDEHLLMLILHELYHIILGHTRLFPRPTQAHNIAFDAYINAILCRQFREPIYLRFFQNLNSWKTFPARLLRPPPGWPDKPKPLPADASKQERKIMRLLYEHPQLMVTYQEILDLLATETPTGNGGDCILLGDHGGQNGDGDEDAKAVADDLIRDVLRHTTSGWPSQSNPCTGRSQGEQIFDFMMPKPKAPRTRFLEALRRLLDKASVLRPNFDTPYAWKALSSGFESLSALPDWRDRHAYSRELLSGHPPLLYQTTINRRRPRWTPQDTAHVYVDVSGSMYGCLPWLAAALDPLHRKGKCRLYAFSTVVDEVKKGRLLRGEFNNTGGTDIDCVYEHIVRLPPARTPVRVLVLTDGMTGSPAPHLHQEWQQRKVRLYVGLVEPGFRNDLTPYAAHVEQFPSPVKD
jgi:hypothetical protein